MAVGAILFLVGALFAALSAALSANATPPWRYDLRTGDHLIYHYTFQRRTHDKEDQTQVEARFRSHVLVLEDSAAHITMGFQRNREAAELTEYVSKGKDRLSKEEPDFQKRMRTRPPHFSEAMEISPTGEAHYPWEIARETYNSHIIDALHEVMPLPDAPLAQGEAWRGNTAGMGLDLHWVGDESIRGKSCHHIAGTSPKGLLKIDYWWSPESGVLEQITLDGSYSDGDLTVHETARMELESRARGEPLERWIESPETRLGALQAILLTPDTPASAQLLASPLSSDETAAQALALGIAVRRRISLPPELPPELAPKLVPNLLHHLQQSSSSLIQAEIRWITSTSGTGGATFDECRRPLPPKSPPAKFGTTFEVAPASKEAAPKESKEANTLGTPYLLRVPVSYHSDGEPSPLLIYLSGGAGFALDAMNSAAAIVSDTDYLVLYPQAAGYWWTPEVTLRFDAVLNDVLQRYNVDRDRIYLTGFSNGGTGALYFAELWPQRFAAVVSLMGAGQCNDQVKAGLANLRNLPLLLVHGENDTTITPDCSQTTQTALNELHPATAPELKILPKREHDLTLQSDDGLTLAFFKDKTRNPFPRTVDLSQFDALAARAYWVEILDGEPGKSDIDVRVKTDNTIDIHSHNVKRIRLHLRLELLPKPGDLRIVWNGKKMFSGPLRDYCSLPAPPSSGDPKLDLADTRDLALP